MSEYFDFDGKPATLSKMIRIEPEWAESRIKAGEVAIRERDTYRDLCADLVESIKTISALTESKNAYEVASDAIAKATMHLCRSFIPCIYKESAY